MQSAKGSARTPLGPILTFSDYLNVSCKLFQIFKQQHILSIKLMQHTCFYKKVCSVKMMEHTWPFDKTNLMLNNWPFDKFTLMLHILTSDNVKLMLHTWLGLGLSLAI